MPCSNHLPPAMRVQPVLPRSVTPRSMSDPRARAADSAMTNAAFMAAREGLGIVLSAVTVVYAFRVIGPEGYGLIGVALAVANYTTRIGALGLDIYAMRQPPDYPRVAIGRLMGVLWIVAGVIGVLIFSFSSSIADLLGVPEAESTVRGAAVWVCLALAARLPVAVLEKEMRFRAVAGIEALAILVYSAVTIGSLIAGAEHWAIVAGMISQQAVTLCAGLALSKTYPMVPGLSGEVRTAVREAMQSQSVVWLWSVRDLAGPVLVGNLLGQRALGVLTAAVLLVSRVMFVRQVGWRLGVAATARMNNDDGLVSAATARAMAVQSVALAILLSLAAVTAQIVLPLLVGPEWEGVLLVFPLIAMGSMVNTVFSFESAALLTAHALRPLAIFHVLHVALLWGSGLFLVPHGLIWYGMAEVIAALSHAYLHRSAQARFGAIAIRDTIVPLAAGSMALAALALLDPGPGSSALAAACLFGMMLDRRTRTITKQVATAALAATHRPRVSEVN